MKNLGSAFFLQFEFSANLRASMCNFRPAKKHWARSRMKQQSKESIEQKFNCCLLFVSTDCLKFCLRFESILRGCFFSLMIHWGRTIMMMMMMMLQSKTLRHSTFEDFFSVGVLEQRKRPMNEIKNVLRRTKKVLITPFWCQINQCWMWVSANYYYRCDCDCPFEFVRLGGHWLVSRGVT